MPKIVVVLFACILGTQCVGQMPKRVSGYLQAQFNTTLYDNTKSNNSGGFGFGLQLLLRDPGRWQPMIEATSDMCAGTKELKMNPSGKPAESVGLIYNLLTGVAFHPSVNTYLSLAAGPGFANDQTFFAIKPSVGVFFANRKWLSRISFTNIFTRDKETGSDLGSISVSIARKLF